jgi:ABC-2 type transporter
MHHRGASGEQLYCAAQLQGWRSRMPLTVAAAPVQSITLYVFMGQLFAYLAPSTPIALMLGGLNHLIWNIFNGFLVPIPVMAVGWRWLNYISATTYVIYALGASQLGDSDQKFIAPGTRAHPAATAACRAACTVCRRCCARSRSCWPGPQLLLQRSRKLAWHAHVVVCTSSLLALAHALAAHNDCRACRVPWLCASRARGVPARA